LLRRKKAMDPITEQILSAREIEVLELIAYGHRNREIAIALEIGERTVRFHVENILDKLGVRNRTEAVYCAFRNGWIND
jgi:DNA-binding NarL/FixJ family response regulator